MSDLLRNMRKLKKQIRELPDKPVENATPISEDAKKEAIDSVKETTKHPQDIHRMKLEQLEDLMEESRESDPELAENIRQYIKVKFDA